ncbi:acyl carrier protein [Streptomyces albofaciens]|uniref:acyl carrier protein n=1 Tax=Streptomyces albofaciens TaxID=66866 RepID=UPI00142EAAA6|nr:acyl carrier protein [Streptomyces albofaciens]
MSVHAAGTSLRTLVLGLVEEVLRAGPVTAEDSFYDFGGSSLQAMRVCVRVQKETGVEISPEALLDSDSLGAFADAVVARAADG